MPRRARAMLLEATGQPLQPRTITVPDPGPGQVRIRVSACGVCRTDLHLVDGELRAPKLPLVPGHEIVGRIDALGAGVERFRLGERIGVPWLGAACGHCTYCVSQRENLCDAPVFTGYTRDGGYAEYTLADARFCLVLPAALDDEHAAPLLCAGLIGFRALRFAGDALRLGLYGFGAAAHLLAQLAVWQGREVYAFTRPGDTDGQDHARSLGCLWAGDSTSPPPQPLDAGLIFAPVGALVPVALRAARKGGVVVCAGIHMSDIPAFEYELLWGERVLRSVANLTRADGDEYLALAAKIPMRADIDVFALAQANDALSALRGGRVRGAAVLRCE
jgi:propanol-preferring alcohol dehydrogenase